MESGIREINAYVDISYGNEEIPDALEYSSNQVNDISNFTILFNSNHTTSKKVFTLEGSTDNALNSSRALVERGNMGWYGIALSQNTVSGNNGYAFSSVPTLSVNFGQNRIIKTLQLFGDSMLEEYPIRFRIRLYEVQNANPIYDKTFLNNNSYSLNLSNKIERTIYILEDLAASVAVEPSVNKIKNGYLTGVQKMQIDILEWNKPGKIVKIQRCYDDILERYSNSELKEFECTQEKSNSAEILYGLVSSTCSVTLLNNKNRKFDYGYLKDHTHLNKRVVPYVNGTKLGTYFIKEWSISQDSMFVGCKGNDRLYDLQDIWFSGMMPEKIGNSYKTVSFYEMFEEIFEYANSYYVKKFKYKIDGEKSDKQNSILNQTYIEPYIRAGSVWSVLQALCEASLSYVYLDSNDCIIVETELGEAEAVTEPQFQIDPRNAFAINIPNYADMSANCVNIPYVEKQIGDTEEIYKIEGITAPANTLLTYEISFDDFYEINRKIAVELIADEITYDISTFLFKVNDFKYQIDYTHLSVLNNATIIIKGKNISFSKRVLEIKDSDSIAKSALNLYIHPENELIQSGKRANLLATKIMKVYCSGTKTSFADWRGDEALWLSDIYTLEDRPIFFGSSTNLANRADYRCTAITTKVSGGMRQETKGMLLAKK